MVGEHSGGGRSFGSTEVAGQGDGDGRLGSDRDRRRRRLIHNVDVVARDRRQPRYVDRDGQRMGAGWARQYRRHLANLVADHREGQAGHGAGHHENGRARGGDHAMPSRANWESAGQLSNH